MSAKEKNILVIRSATRVLSQTLRLLKSEFPESHITVLGAGSAADNLRLDPSIDDVVTFDAGKGPVSLFNIGSETLRGLREKQFDLAVGLYNIDHGLGYSNIDLLAWSVRPKQIRGYNPQGKHTVHTTQSVFKKILLERTSLFWIVANYAATAVLFTLITLGLCIEWCVRKIRPPSYKPPELKRPSATSRSHPASSKPVTEAEIAECLAHLGS